MRDRETAKFDVKTFTQLLDHARAWRPEVRKYFPINSLKTELFLDAFVDISRILKIGFNASYRWASARVSFLFKEKWFGRSAHFGKTSLESSYN